MFVRAYRRTVIAGVAAIALVPGLAAAQDRPAPDSSDQAQDSDIVVTGTLIRGAPPVGSNEITIGQQKLDETGAISANALLASLPQVTNYFNRVPLADLGGAAAINQIQISRPNIRNISPSNASSAATLILVDGHRIASAGVNQASVDPDAIPTGAIDHVEVVTEGGSSTYGADAVAGVINFITLKRFDGVKANMHVGLANDYRQWDASVTAGKAWDNGSVYISYTYTKSDPLFGSDRSFIHNLDYTAQPYVGRDVTCANPNLAVNTVIPAFGVTVASTNYAAPGFAPGTINHCDHSQDSTYLPEAQRHGVVVGFNQDIGDGTTLDVRGFYSRRETRSSFTLTGTVPVGSGNPYASSLPAGLVLGPTTVTIPGIGTLPAVNQAAVNFSLEPVLGAGSAHATTLLQEWGANAELKHNIDGNWQVRALANYSGSDSRYDLPQISPAGLLAAGVATTTATAIDPFDVTQTNPALIQDLIDSELAGQAKDELVNFRVIVEGKLFELPGGDARLAAGYEYMHDRLEQRFESDVPFGGLDAFPFTSYARHIHSLFGELQLPLISDGNGGSMLTVSAQGRYDHYSDFGDTFNPKLGATFKPAHWLTLRGNWGTSFTAPTPLDQLGSLRNTFSSFPFVAFAKPGEATPPGAYTVALQGSKPGLQPQKATTWSLGVDLDPLEGLHASVNYYDVNFKDILSTPTPNSGIFTNFPNNVATAPTGFTAAQLLAYGAMAPGGTAVAQSLINSGTLVYEFDDFRVGNYGIMHVKGLDFSLGYSRKVSFGSVDLSVAGNYELSRKQQVSSTSPVIDYYNNDGVDEPSRLQLQTTAGTTIGGFRGQVTWNHSAGYDIPPTTSVPVQDHVGAFDTVDLFFKYDVPADSGIMRNLSFTLNVSNVFDKDPPVLLRNNPAEVGFANGFTIGRMFILGVAKKF